MQAGWRVMGLTVHDLRLLIEARRSGARLERVLTLGRQWVLASPRQIRSIGVTVPHGFQSGDYFDTPAVASAFGVREAVALDRSNYEGAQLVHDLNSPIHAGQLGQ